MLVNNSPHPINPVRSRDRRVLILPILMLPFTIIGSCFIIKLDVVAYIDLSAFNVLLWGRWAGALFIGDVILNGLVTLLIIGKLFYVGYRTKAITTGGDSNKYARIILVLVESGSFLVLWLLGFSLLMLVPTVSSVSTPYFGN